MQVLLEVGFGFTDREATTMPLEEAVYSGFSLSVLFTLLVLHGCFSIESNSNGVDSGLLSCF